MDKWFVTIGVPGGEYACKAESAEAAMVHFAYINFASMRLSYGAGGEDDSELVSSYIELDIRPAPPDLVEWIEAEMHKSQLDEINCCRYKTPGGWLYFDCAAQGVCFVPVPLAAGLTVIKGEKA